MSCLTVITTSLLWPGLCLMYAPELFVQARPNAFGMQVMGQRFQMLQLESNCLCLLCVLFFLQQWLA